MSNLWAEVRLLVWQPTPSHPRFLLPVKEGETNRQAVESYRALLHSGTELKEVLPPSVFQNSEGSYSELPKGRDKSLFIANNAGDHRIDAARVQKFMAQLPQTDNYVLALGAAERLRPGARAQFYDKIVSEFAGLVAMGGDDVTPKMYREPVTYARGFNGARDALEIELIRAYVKAEKGFMFGVCRGHQITSVALGYKMVQDIPIEIQSPTRHADNDHVVRQLTTTHGILRTQIGSLRPFEAYSWHHQSVIFHEGGPLELAAVSPEGITEALEFKNGKGLLVQFHPELKSAPESVAILEGVWNGVRSHVGTFSCRRVLRH
ncbi:MAG: gamma-glutamyl-gamma-aminobutyrate hydrolase family protein [Bdellovibrionaceae bacterium]|nr:gamma-glutamyl-gamma-aminobutyrate hydrolase family protein [Pseudobdellovibrionaceae bacterium]